MPRIRDELFPALKALQTAQCPFRNRPGKKGVAVGRIFNSTENEAMPLGHPEAGLLGRIRRMDRRRALASLKPTGDPQRHINRELLPSSFPSVSLVEQFSMRRGRADLRSDNGPEKVDHLRYAQQKQDDRRRGISSCGHPRK